MNQSLVQKQSQRLTPQQIVVAGMVQATNDELERIINEELEKNVALERDYGNNETDGSNEFDGNDEFDGEGNETSEHAAKMEDMDQTEHADREEVTFDYDDDAVPMTGNAQNRSADDPDWSPTEIAQSDHDFREDLITQLKETEDLDEEEERLAEYIVDSLEDDGYLRISLDDLSDDLAFRLMLDVPVSRLEEVLTETVQMLEPAGIGARNLRECLLLQLLDKTSTPAVELAYRVVDRAFDDYIAHRYERVCQTLATDMASLKEAQHVLSRLNPKPGGQSTSTIEGKAQQITPDFSIHVADNQLNVNVLDERVPMVCISRDEEESLRQLEEKAERRQKENRKPNPDDEEGRRYLTERINSGRQFIDALKQRHRTLSRTIQVLAEMQREFFFSGGDLQLLKPMTLQDVADKTGFDVSTLSRVSNSKFIETDFGTIAVRDLYTSGIADAQGNIVSNVAAQQALKEIVTQEDKTQPMSDELLSAVMKEKGFPISRRTVAKYRDILGIPTARERQSLIANP